MWDAAYYITVDRFKDRQTYVEGQFKTQGLEVEKFLGVDKNNININYLMENGYVNNLIKLNKSRSGNAACLLSHCLLYKKILEENKDNDKEIFLIFEDDIKLLPNLKKNILLHTKYVPNDWDMIWLGHNKLVGTSINKWVVKPINNAGRGKNAEHHCYLIKKSSINKILNILLPMNYINKLTKDTFIRKNFHRFNAYFIRKKLALQNKNFKSKRIYSTIKQPIYVEFN